MPDNVIDENQIDAHAVSDPSSSVSVNPTGGSSPEDMALLLARTAKDWLTFERLRQELQNLGASDPLLVGRSMGSDSIDFELLQSPIPRCGVQPDLSG